MSTNSVNISGRLGKDSELRSTQSGSSVLNFSVAVSDGRKNPQSGKWEETTHWIDCVAFGKRAESLSRILKRGTYVEVTGKLSQSKWKDKNGNNRSKVEVVANDVNLPPRGNQSQQQAQQGQQYQQQGNYTDQQQYDPQNGYQQPTGYQQPDLYPEPLPF